jgi:hypothetical protein
MSNNDIQQIIVILIGIVILAAVVYYGTSKHKELVEKGVIRERPANFERELEIFTTSSDFKKIWNELNGMTYNTQVSYVLSQNPNIIKYKGDGWEGVLKEESKNGEKYRYCFKFTHWETRNDMNLSGVDMNTFLTSLEKAFLRLDPEVLLEKKLFKVKTSYKLF